MRRKVGIVLAVMAAVAVVAAIRKELPALRRYRKIARM